jgi:hypothetical protein
VIDDGHLVERGRHEELLETGGLYGELYRTLVRGGEATPLDVEAAVDTIEAVVAAGPG